MEDTLIYFGLFIALGAVAGLLAGLLGVGGGIIIVPALSAIFVMQGHPAQYIAHIAIGTSLATIIFTAISSIRAHHGHGAVDWGVFARITPGILIGAGLGSVLAAQLSTHFLKWLFALFVTYVAIQMLLDIKPKSTRVMPGTSGLIVAGSLIGWLSSLVGIGGGTMSVPFLLWSNLSMQRAIATSAAIGLPIAVSGTIGYILNGWSNTELQRFSLGFVYIPALAAVSIASMATAPIGARLTHSISVKRLKKVFAVFLLIMATKLLWGLLI